MDRSCSPDASVPVPPRQVAICGVDNNPARVAVSLHFRARKIPVIFVAVSRDADHGYVFVQEPLGTCIGCLFQDLADDDRYPCPGTPAIADILQAMGALAVYAVDTLLMRRPRSWNYRRLGLSDAAVDGASVLATCPSCRICGHMSEQYQTSIIKPEKESDNGKMEKERVDGACTGPRAQEHRQRCRQRTPFDRNLGAL